MAKINGFELLANAIITRAVEDYERYIYIINKKSSDTLDVCKAIAEKDNIRKFFNSGYYEVLTKVNREIMLNELDRLDKGGTGLWRKQSTRKI